MQVRKCAQTCIQDIFTSFEDLDIRKKASEFIDSLFERYAGSIIQLSHVSYSVSNFEAPSEPILVESLQFLDVLKLVIPSLSIEVGLNILDKLIDRMRPKEYTALTRHILMITDAYFSVYHFDAISPILGKIIPSFCQYLSQGANKPVDTKDTVLKLLRSAIYRVNVMDHDLCVQWLPVVIRSIIGAFIHLCAYAPSFHIVNRQFRCSLLTLGNLLTQLHRLTAFSLVISCPTIFS